VFLSKELSESTTFKKIVKKGMKLFTSILVRIMMAHCVYSFQFQQSARCILFSSRPTIERSSRQCLRRLFSTSSGESEKKRVVFLGTPEVAASSLRTIYEASQQDGSGYEIVSVITQPPKRRRRKGKLEPSPVGKVAEELELEVLCPEKVGY
jgi:hypothetical protein